MAKRLNLSVSVTLHHAAFLERCVASGRYLSASEVIREGLRLLEDRLDLQEVELERARMLNSAGADSLQPSDVVEGGGPFYGDGDEDRESGDRP